MKLEKGISKSEVRIPKFKEPLHLSALRLASLLTTTADIVDTNTRVRTVYPMRFFPPLD
jgi:hypothetical protein